MLDECDRILDMGFQETMNAIIDYLPTERQTLMFSATQTKCIIIIRFFCVCKNSPITIYDLLLAYIINEGKLLVMFYKLYVQCIF